MAPRDGVQRLVQRQRGGEAGKRVLVELLHLLGAQVGPAPNVAFTRRRQAQQHLAQRRLATAALAQQGQAVARMQAQRHVAEEPAFVAAVPHGVRL